MAVQRTSDVSADGNYCSSMSAPNAHGWPATVTSYAARMTSAAPAAAREDGVCAYQQRHSQQNRNRPFH